MGIPSREKTTYFTEKLLLYHRLISGNDFLQPAETRARVGPLT
jgi:hypothetical protein